MDNRKKHALVTGANRGIGLHVAKQLAAAGWAVFIGCRSIAEGQSAAEEVGHGSQAIELDLTNTETISKAATTIEQTAGRLDLLVNNAGISTPASLADLPIEERRKKLKASTISSDSLREIWETNVFGTLSVTQAMLPLLRHAERARVVMVSSGLGSLALNSAPDAPFRDLFTPGYAGSKAALNIIGLALAIELEKDGIRVNMASPGHTATRLNDFQGTETIEEGAREVIRVALLEDDDRSGAFTAWEGQAIPF